MQNLPRHPGGRPRSGTLEQHGTHPDGSTRWRFRLRLADGSKSERFDLAAGLTEKQARAVVAGYQAEEDAKGELLAAKREKARHKAAAERVGCEGETADAWFARYVAYQRECGHTDPTKFTRWRKWVTPRFGHKAMASVTRDDVEALRDDLDAAVLAWATEGRGPHRISGKTAMNVWSTVTSSFREATRSKRKDLAVLRGQPNPCADVIPPGDATSRRARRKAFVYPREHAALMACEAVPLEWREVHALAAYLYLRPGELRVLMWGDVDRDAGHVLVTKAWDYAREDVKAPKTHTGTRTVPIESSLAPLLSRMAHGRSARDLVCPIMSDVPDNKLGVIFREHLALAGVTRAELHTATATHALANFRTWRDSGITWLAMSGVDLIRIQRRAGHEKPETTLGYVKQAEDLGDTLGEPFARLPSRLLQGSQAASMAQSLAQNAPKSSDSWRRARDSNPCIPHASHEPRNASAHLDDLDPRDRALAALALRGFGPAFGPSDGSLDERLERACERALRVGRAVGLELAKRRDLA